MTPAPSQYSTTRAPDTLLEAALSYIQRGWAALPLAAGTKDRPLTLHGSLGASKDPPTVRDWWARWPDANVAIATGPASDGLTILDVDERHGGGESLAALEAAHGPLPDGPVVLTPGGRHHYLRAQGVRNSVGLLGTGLDVRGAGGYALLPPSLHPSGELYRWELSSGPELPVPAAPAWLLELLDYQDRRDGHHGAAEPLPQRIPQGRRNSTLASLAGSLRRRGASAAAIEAALAAENESRCDPPLEEAEVRGIATSVARYKPASQGGDAAAAGEGATVPGWTWSAHGLYQVRDGAPVRVLARSVEIRGMVRAGRTKSLDLLLNAQPVLLPASLAASRPVDAARALAEVGVTLTSDQVRPLQRFLADALDTGQDIPTTEGSPSLGWHGDALVLGDPDDPVRFIPAPEAAPLFGYGRRAPTSEGAACVLWRDTLRGFPPAGWAVLGAAAASPCLGKLPPPWHTFLLHAIGPRGTGKTTLGRLAIALVGDPDRLTLSWATTVVGLERLAAGARHLPLFLDESSLLPRPEELAARIMLLAAGEGRARGSADGLRPLASWRLVVLSTGESLPLQSGPGGAARRVLTVAATLGSAQEARQCDLCATQAYGWPARWLRPLWLDSPRWQDRLNLLAGCWETFLDGRPGALPGLHRLWALTELGAQLVAEAIGVPLEPGILGAVALDSLAAQAERLDGPDRLLWAVGDDVASYPDSYARGPATAFAPRQGWFGRDLGDGRIAVLRSRLEELARRRGLSDLDQALRVLWQRGALDSAPGRLPRRVRVGELNPWCFVFRLPEGGDES